MKKPNKDNAGVSSADVDRLLQAVAEVNLAAWEINAAVEEHKRALAAMCRVVSLLGEKKVLGLLAWADLAMLSPSLDERRKAQAIRNLVQRI